MSATLNPSRKSPRLLVYGNEWGLLELPQRPSLETWSFEQCLEKLSHEGFAGCQADAARGDLVRSFGLRFAASTRISAPEETNEQVARAADAGADVLTVHLGWGMEDDAAMDAFISAVLEASSKYNIPIYPETHRATIFQDVWRTRQALRRFPGLYLNGDFSHYYCGQEMVYPGFTNSKENLHPILPRVRFLHGRVSNGECIQCDLADPANRPHLDNFSDLWREVFRSWLISADRGEVFIFAPELGPPSSGYSISFQNPEGTRTELSDRWRDTLELKRLAERLFEEALPFPP